MGFNLYMHNQHKDVCVPQNGETIGTLMINHRNLGDPIFRQTLGRGIDRMSRHVSHAFSIPALNQPPLRWCTLIFGAVDS